MGLTASTGHVCGWAVVVVVVGLMLAGCHAPPLATPTDPVLEGRYTDAARLVRADVEDDKRDRRYVLTRMRAGVMELAADQPKRAEGSLAEVYDLLRTQGVNRDKMLETVVVNEGVRVWKGEPFEQALAMTYFGLTAGVLGSWDNVRAAAQSSLFQLRDFGQAGRSGRPSHAGNGYVVTASDFTLGYLLHGIASQQLGRDDKARDFLDRAIRLNPALKPMRDRLWTQPYNAVLVASYGLGPRKEAHGPSNALSRFVPVFASTNAPLAVKVNGQRQDDAHVVTDVNRMATDHRWNHLEDLRVTKANLGQASILAGSVLTSDGLEYDNDRTAMIGLGLLAMGAYLEYQAKANTDYCDVFPQRFYVLPLWLEPEDSASAGSTVELQVSDRATASARLQGLKGAATGQPAKLIYFRLPAYNGSRSGVHRNRRANPLWR
ncbi:MAG: hypothetical protein AAF797_09425 [Planctomycetota bacterium]